MQANYMRRHILTLSGKVDTGYLRDNPGSTRDSNDEGCPDLGVRGRLGQLWPIIHTALLLHLLPRLASVKRVVGREHALPGER